MATPQTRGVAMPPDPGLFGIEIDCDTDTDRDFELGCWSCGLSHSLRFFVGKLSEKQFGGCCATGPTGFPG